MKVKTRPVTLDYATGIWYVPDDIEVEVFSLAYPCTVVADRYMGTYSGGMFTSWSCLPDKVPSAIAEDDVTCREFWQGAGSEFRTRYVGRGDTAEEAFKDMKRRLGTV